MGQQGMLSSKYFNRMRDLMTTKEQELGNKPEEDNSHRDAALPQKISRREVTRVVIRISGVTDLLELEGDDVDLGTDLKVRYQHKLIAEFRRDAVDGWWYKSYVVNEAPPFGGEGNASDVGDLVNDGSST